MGLQEVTEIRRMRLKEWFSDRTLPEKEKSYLSQLVTGRAPFGEKAARRLEREYRMGDRYLDYPGNTEGDGEHAEEIAHARRSLLALEIGRQGLSVICSRCRMDEQKIKNIASGSEPFSDDLAASIGYLIRPDFPRKDWLILGNIPEPKPELENLLEDGFCDGLRIYQFDTGGGMGSGVVLKDQPGVIQGWKISEEWAKSNLPAHSGIGNICIITGFGDSMRGMFEPGDPLIVDMGITVLDHDGVFFFSVVMNGHEEGFIKRLQRVPGKGVRVISQNKEYETYTIKEGSNFRILGKVLKVWNSKVF